jgi:uncharacterized phiE125 gp8 family phage protein
MQNYNLIIGKPKILDEDTTEPVSVIECKQYMKLEGFQDVDDSGATEFTEDDDLIALFITAARRTLEAKYGISLVEKTLRTTFTNLAGDIEIPYGPVVSVSSLKDRNGDDITTANYTLVGDEYKQLECPQYEKMQITYKVGFEEVPEDLKVEILRMVNWMFSKRDEDDKLKGFTYTTGHYSRNTIIC